ncbi:MAG: NUDIX hydrolase [Proteobacteria bacterium]|nr:NUDIX hydrolase [Pseudomonadota bacterium]
MIKPKQIASRALQQGRVVTFCSDRLLFANGQEYDIDMIRHPGASAIVALDAQRRVCLVRQYRHGVEDFLWEIPAGKLDRGEPPQTAAIRELAEEAGVTAGHWESLGEFLPAPGLITERVHLFLAMRLTKGEPFPEGDEELELQWLPLEQAMRMVIDGRLDDGKTAMALIRAHGRLQT